MIKTASEIERTINKVGVDEFHKDPMGALSADGFSLDDWAQALNEVDSKVPELAEVTEASSSVNIPIAHGYVTAKIKILGLEIRLSEQASRDVEAGNTEGVFTYLSGDKHVGHFLASLIAPALKLCGKRIKAVDKGEGVHIVIYWPVVGTFASVFVVAAYFAGGLKAN